MSVNNTFQEKSETPLVSAIVAAYNAERFMRGLLEDLQAQTIADKMEIIIVETGSETQEIDIVREYQERFSNIIYVRTSGRVSAVAATNIGVKMATGKFIALTPTDDRLRRDALEVMAKVLAECPEVGTVYADVLMTQFENQTFEKCIRSGYSIRFDFSPDMMLTGYHMGPLFMSRKTVYEQVGLFDERFLCGADFDFHCRVALKMKMKHIPQFLGLYMKNPNGVVLTNVETSNLEFSQIKEKYRNQFPPPIDKPFSLLFNQQKVVIHRYVNICMVTFNRLEFTKSSIASILQYTCFPHVLTVVDNGSTDGTVEYLQAMKKEGIITNLILLKENVGVAKASNLAWSQEPKAGYYMKLDNDIVIQKPNWLERMVEALDASPQLAMVAYNFEPCSYPIQMINGQKMRPKMGNLNGACVLIPKRTEQQLGFWCEDYGLYGEEDADYGGRIILAGLHNAYMEDEDIGVHLPAGKAASIDPGTSKAEDGIEEYEYSEYRRFKDNLRHVNKQGPFKENFDLYQTGKKPLYCKSGFVESFQTGIVAESSTSLPQRAESAPPIPKEVLNPSSPPDRRVSVIVNDQFCGVLRMIYPLKSCLQKKGMTGQVLIEGEIWKGKEALPIGKEESIVVQRIANLIEPKLTQAKAQGTRIVHDIDDLLWRIPEDNHNRQVITRPMLECLFRVMELADCVTVSTEPLQQALVSVGIPSRILPNCLLEEHWDDLTPSKRFGTRPRVGWVGQMGVHREDVAILTPVIEALGQEVEWVFLGEIPKVRPGVRFEAENHSMVPLQDFPAKLASLNLDLALAPLAINEFNEAKSDLRILQYGILGYPVIATDIFPYRAAPVTRVSNDPKAWIMAIREQLHDRDSSEAQGEQLRQWVLNNRMFTQWAPLYQAAWLGESGEKENQSEFVHPPQATSSIPASIGESKNVRYDCSIIIPLFNRVDLTKQCLEQLSKVTHGLKYEVVLVDNHSTDGTAELFEGLSGDVQIIRNQENLGFAKACNQGAAAAKGKYLVFLNNDTIPQEGWLSALVDEVQQHPDVAVVGSKLLFPDNTIQHAGVVFSKNCLIPYHIFRGESSQLSAVNMRREFQAVTAACFLVRREDWESVKGFNEEFKNGFEDVDLCLKIGERGRKVIYQPLSVLYHLEHQSPGRKNSETEQHNGRLLMDLWATKIIPDEDVYYVSEGYANRLYVKDGMIRQRLTAFQNEHEKQQWQQLEKTQKLLLEIREMPCSHLEKGCPSELRALLSECSKWPDDLESLRWGAQLCRTWKCQESEGGFWRRILSLQDDPEAREFLAKEALSQNDLVSAAQHVTALVESRPHEGMGYGLQGILLMQSQQYEAAAESFCQALRNNFDTRKGGMGLGMAYMGMDEFAKAWEAFQHIVANHPDDEEVMNWLLQSGTMLQRWEELILCLSRFLDRNPTNCDIRFALAGVCYRAGEFAEAKKHFDILQMLTPEYEGLEDLRSRLEDSQVIPPSSAKDQTIGSSLFNSQTLQDYYQPPIGNTEKYIRVIPAGIVDHTASVHQALKEYDISGFGTGIDAVENILSIVFQRQFSQTLTRSCDMWDRVVALTIDCELAHGITGQSFSSLQPRDLEDIDLAFAQQEGETRKGEIASYLKKLKNKEYLGKPLYISGKILQYLGAPAEEKAMYMLDGARRLSASALNHQERMPIILLALEEEFAQLLRKEVKTGLQDRIQQLAWFQNYHSIPLLGITGERSLERFKLMETVRLKDSVILDFGCNLGQASLKAIQFGAREVWGIEGMKDTVEMATQIKDIAGCDHLQYLQVDFNDPNFDQIIDQRIPMNCDFSFFFSVYRTKELTQRDRLFNYILQKTTKGIFFEGHAHPKIDTIEYYEWLFDSLQLTYTFLGYSEQQTRPLFYLDLEGKGPQLHNKGLQKPTIDLNPIGSLEASPLQSNLVNSQ